MQKLELNFIDGENAENICMMDDWLGYFDRDVMAHISFGKHYGFLDQERNVNNL